MHTGTDYHVNTFHQVAEAHDCKVQGMMADEGGVQFSFLCICVSESEAAAAKDVMVAKTRLLLFSPTVTVANGS